jgi:hypothetical protein
MTLKLCQKAFLGRLIYDCYEISAQNCVTKDTRVAECIKIRQKNTGKRLYSSQNLPFSTVLYSRMLKYTYNVHSKNVNSETKTSFKTVKHKQENKAKIKEQDNYSVRCLRYPKCSCLANRAYLVSEKSSCAKKIFPPKNPSDSVCQETFTGGRLFKSRLA